MRWSSVAQLIRKLSSEDGLVTTIDLRSICSCLQLEFSCYAAMNSPALVREEPWRRFLCPQSDDDRVGTQLLWKPVMLSSSFLNILIIGSPWAILVFIFSLRLLY